MLFYGKYNILGIQIDACDYDYILCKIDKHFNNKRNKSILISPMTTHVLTKAKYDKKIISALDKFDLLPPDSQWLRYSLNFLYGVNLKDRVYGPELTLRICKKFQGLKYRIFLYGTNSNTLQKLKSRLMNLFPNINIIYSYAPTKDVFGMEEQQKFLHIIKKSKANLIFVALGSPKQEVFLYNIFQDINKLKEKIAIIEIGAAFDFISGVKPQAPKIIGDYGLEWLFRLIHEPRRLWKRYVIDGLIFIALILFQKLRFSKRN